MRLHKLFSTNQICYSTPGNLRQNFTPVIYAMFTPTIYARNLRHIYSNYSSASSGSSAACSSDSSGSNPTSSSSSDSSARLLRQAFTSSTSCSQPRIVNLPSGVFRFFLGNLGFHLRGPTFTQKQ